MATAGEAPSVARHSLEKKVSVVEGKTEDKKPRRNINVTAKYNRKQMTLRLKIEEWMDEQLRKLYECEEDEDYPVEIDIDVLLETDVDTERVKFVRDILTDVRQPTEPFISELLKKIEVLNLKNVVRL